MGTAAAAGIESRDRNARVPIEFKRFRLPRRRRHTRRLFGNLKERIDPLIICFHRWVADNVLTTRRA
jgi:hypothetical protein